MGRYLAMSEEGGRPYGINACLKGLVEYSIKSDEKAGDDTFHRKDPNAPDWDFDTIYKALPRCRNDSEFDFVLGMLLEEA
jgi:hypothetical protein